MVTMKQFTGGFGVDQIMTFGPFPEGGLVEEIVLRVGTAPSTAVSEFVLAMSNREPTTITDVLASPEIIGRARCNYPTAVSSIDRDVIPIYRRTTHEARYLVVAFIANDFMGNLAARVAVKFRPRWAQL